MNEERIITVFGSSRPAEGDPDYQEAFHWATAGRVDLQCAAAATVASWKRFRAAPKKRQEKPTVLPRNFLRVKPINGLMSKCA